MHSHLKQLSVGVLITALIILSAGCKDAPKQSSVFEGTDLSKLILVGAERDNSPQAKYTIHLKMEYALKDCELVAKVPDDYRSNYVAKIVANCTNTIVRLGGTISSMDHSSEWGSCEMTYTAPKATGTVRLYSMDLGNSKLKVVVVMFECPTKW